MSLAQKARDYFAASQLTTAFRCNRNVGRWAQLLDGASHVYRGFVAQISCRSSYPNPRTDLSHADRLRRAQCCEAIQNRGTDLKLRHLSVKVS